MQLESCECSRNPMTLNHLINQLTHVLVDVLEIRCDLGIYLLIGEMKSLCLCLQANFSGEHLEKWNKSSYFKVQFKSKS